MPEKLLKNYFLSENIVDPKFINKLKNLITLNILSLLKRSNLAYISSTATGEKVKKNDFFLKLVKTMQKDLSKYCKENGLANNSYSLEVFLGGGSVRSILGYVYENLYKQLSLQSVSNQKIAYIDSLHQELNDKIEKNELAEYFKNYIENTYLTKVDDIQATHLLKNQTTWKKKLKYPLLDNLIEFLLKEMNFSKELDPRCNKDAYDEFANQVRSIDPTLLKETISNMIEFMKFNQKVLSSSEFDLTISKLSTKKLFAPGFVLGVGSDLDIYYRLKFANKRHEDENITNDTFDKVKEIIEESAKEFINSARKYYQLKFDGTRNEFVDSILPEADVKEIDQQLSRAATQGGSLLDLLAFKLNIELLDSNSQLSVSRNTNKTNHYKERKTLIRLLKEDLWEGPKTGITLPNGEKIKSDGIVDHILKSFISGYYDYIPPSSGYGNTSFKQSIRGLRPLYEIPFLQIKDQKTIQEELSQKLEQQTTLSSMEIKQIKKLIRNARLSGGNNRVNEDELMKLFLNIIKQHDMMPETDEKVYFTQFVEALPLNRPQTGAYTEQLNRNLISKKDFLEKYTDNKTLYHGTKSIENIIPILRGGFVQSTGNIEDNTTAIYGSGLYTTNEEYIAKSYSRDSLLCLPLHITEDPRVHIINLEKISPELKENLESEMKAKHYVGDLNKFLREHYSIDIIVNSHVIIQNANAIVPPKISQLFLMELERLLMEDISNATLERIEKILSIFNFIDSSNTQHELNNFNHLLLKKLQLQIKTNPLSDLSDLSDKNKIFLFKAYINLQKQLFGSHSPNEEADKKIILNIIQKAIKQKSFIIPQDIRQWFKLQQELFQENGLNNDDYEKIILHIIQTKLYNNQYLSLDYIRECFLLQQEFFQENGLNNDDYEKIILHTIQTKLYNNQYLSHDYIRECFLLQQEFFQENGLNNDAYRQIILHTFQSIVNQKLSISLYEIEALFQLQQSFFGEDSINNDSYKQVLFNIVQNKIKKNKYNIDIFEIKQLIKLQRKFFGENDLHYDYYKKIIFNIIQEKINQSNQFKMISRKEIKELIKLQQAYFGKDSINNDDYKQIISTIINIKLSRNEHIEMLLADEEIEDWLIFQGEIFKKDGLNNDTYEHIILNFIQQRINQDSDSISVADLEILLEVQCCVFGEKSLHKTPYKNIVFNIVQQKIKQKNFDTLSIAELLKFQEKTFRIDGGLKDEKYKQIIFNIIQQQIKHPCEDIPIDRIEQLLNLQKNLFGSSELKGFNKIILDIIEQQIRTSKMAWLHPNIIQQWFKLQEKFFKEDGLKDFNKVILKIINQYLTNNNEAEFMKSKMPQTAEVLHNNISLLSKWLDLQQKMFGQPSLKKIQEPLKNFIIHKFSNKVHFKENLLALNRLMEIYKNIYGSDAFYKKTLQFKDSFSRSKSLPVLLSSRQKHDTQHQNQKKSGTKNTNDVINRYKSL